MESDKIWELDGYELSNHQKNLWLESNGDISSYGIELIIDLNDGYSHDYIKETVAVLFKKNRIFSYRKRSSRGSIYPEQFYFPSESIQFCVSKPSYKRSLSDLADEAFENCAESSSISFCLFNNCRVVTKMLVRFSSFWFDTYSALKVIEELKEALLDHNEYLEKEVQGIDFLDVAAWQNEMILEPEQEAVDFWKSFTMKRGFSQIPFGKSKVKTFEYSKKQLKIEGDAYKQLINHAVELNADKEDVLMSFFADYIRCFDEKPVQIGFSSFSRSYAELDDTIGKVSGLLPIKIDNSSSDIINEIKNRKKNILNWGDYFSFDANYIEENRKQFEYQFSYIPVGKQDTSVDSELVIKDLNYITGNFDVQVVCTDFHDHLLVDVYTNSKKYDDFESKLIQAQLVHKYETLSQSTDLSKHEIELINKSHSNQKDFNEKNSILNLFDQAVQKDPKAIALHGALELTYEELDLRSDQLADYLQNSEKLAKGDGIAIISNPDTHFVISLLAVLKLGAFYIPIDANNPSQRINLILQDCLPKLVISSLDIQCEYPLIDPTQERIYKRDVEKICVDVSNEDLVYMIYTSGSTGKPKGCPVNQKNLLNYIQWANEKYFNHSEDGNWALITSIAFDLTVTSIFTSLTHGKQLWVNQGSNEIYEVLKKVIDHPQIDTLKLTPSHIDVLRNLGVKATKIQTVILGGEQLKSSQVRYLKEINPEIKIYNEYGPTEATVGCIVSEVESEDKITIGYPIANTQIQILSNEGSPVPVGITGEIYISGDGVINNYHNRPNLTEGKFLNDQDSLVQKTYKTGDLAKWLPDGSIEYLGRIDNQVKLRGYRVELTEIDHHLENINGILSAHSLVYRHEESQDKLISFLVSNQEIHIEPILSELSDSLPDYMIPNQVVQIPELPLTLNGKIDQEKLIKISEEALVKEREVIAPRNEMEVSLLEIWKTILEQESICVTDNFFHLGGHSLLAINLSTSIQKISENSFPLSAVFDYPTIESQAKYLSEEKDEESSCIIQLNIGDDSLTPVFLFPPTGGLS